jgi:thioredoxin-dependent peroxiredoxin
MLKNTKLNPGDAAPRFTLPGFPEQKYRLAEALSNGPVILYFYPRDDTPGCTREACGFQEFLPKLEKLKAIVFGISGDDPVSHGKFARKFGLKFPLLSDIDHKICEKYGVWVEKNMYGKKSMGIQRATFLINSAGKISAIWPKVKVEGHVEEVAQTLADL